MTDEITPNGDPNEQTRDAIERLLPKAVAGLEELISSGGKRTVRAKCQACGASVTSEVQVADADLLVKAVSALSSAAPRLQNKDDSASRRAREILKELEDMTSEEIAELIAELEREQRDAAGD